MMVLVRNAVRAVQVFSENVRTKAGQLRREKRRAEGLVYQMLPRSGHWHHQGHLTSLLRTVADNLRGSKNTSEMFDSATVCFTEIDGCFTVNIGHYDTMMKFLINYRFKIIARSCTPLQLFDLLNTIYKTFDAR